MVDPRLEGLLGSGATANEILRDRAVRHSMFLERLSAGERRRILSFLNRDLFPDVIERLSGRLSRIRLRGFDRGPVTTAGLRDLAVSLDEMIANAFRRIRPSVFGSMHDLAKTEAAWQIGAIDGASPIQFDLVTPAAGTLRAIVNRRSMDGKLMREWWAGIPRNLQGETRRQLSIGIAQGDTNDQIVRRLRGRGRAGVGGVFDMTRRQTTAFVRTGTRHVASHARELAYEANQDVVRAVQYIATLDSRTTDICMSLDGREFPVGEGPRPPMHHQCRSDTVPVLKSWKELGIDLKEAPAGTRESLNGQVPDSLNYDGWLRRMDANPGTRGLVDEALGPGRARLWREGVSVRKFTDQQFRPLTIDQIRAREGLN